MIHIGNGIGAGIGPRGYPVMTDQARPRFWVPNGARPAVERWHQRHGYPAPDWRLRDRAVARFRGEFASALLSPRESREAGVFQRIYHGPYPEMQRAVRFVRRRYLLSRLIVAVRRAAL